MTNTPMPVLRMYVAACTLKALAWLYCRTILRDGEIRISVHTYSVTVTHSEGAAQI